MADLTWIKGTIDPPESGEYYVVLEAKHNMIMLDEEKGVVAYSSTGAGHEGIVYQADGWFNVSTTKSGCRDCRDGRKNVDTSAKIKWVRTP